MSKVSHQSGDKGSNGARGLSEVSVAVSALPKGRGAAQALLGFYTIGQVAEALSVSTRTVRRWIADDALPAHRFGAVVRISDIDFRAFVAMHREG
jgi:excisionase family DNA binding protein